MAQIKKNDKYAKKVWRFSWEPSRSAVLRTAHGQLGQLQWSSPKAVSAAILWKIHPGPFTFVVWQRTVSYCTLTVFSSTAELPVTTVTQMIRVQDSHFSILLFYSNSAGRQRKADRCKQGRGAGFINRGSSKQPQCSSVPRAPSRGANILQLKSILNTTCTLVKLLAEPSPQQYFQAHVIFFSQTQILWNPAL